MNANPTAMLSSIRECLSAGRADTLCSRRVEGFAGAILYVWVWLEAGL